MRTFLLTLPLAASFVVGACSSSKVDPIGQGSGGSANGATGGNGSGVNSKTGGGPNSLGGSKASGGAVNSSAGQGNAGAAGGPSSLVSTDPAYEGINLDGVSVGQAPTGCAAGPDSAGKLTLEWAISQTVIIQVRGSELFVNDVSCGTGVMSLAVTGSAGADTIVFDRTSGGPLPSATVNLGEGTDAVWLRGSADAETIRVGMDAGNLVMGDGTVRFVEAMGAESVLVSAGPGDDHLFADGLLVGTAPSSLPVEFFGGDGDDEIVGGAGNDRLHGGAGLDTFRSPSLDGSDTYDGGSSNCGEASDPKPCHDVLTYEGRSAPLTVTVGAGADDGEQGENDDVQDTVEDVTGGTGDDTLTGSAGDNTFNGGAGNDTLSGGDGSDTLYGDAGNDSLMGGDGDDTILDSLGTNQIDGGPGGGDICVPNGMPNCEL